MAALPKPFPFQTKALRWLQNHPKAFLMLEQGLGKTVVAALDLDLDKSDLPCLIICPASIKYNWKDELAVWQPSYQVQVIDKKTDHWHASADVWIINYDILHKVTVPQSVRSVIVDESHYAKQPTATRTKHVAAAVRKAKKVRLLSGTPIVNSPIDLWAMMYAMKMTKMTWKNWGFRYCAGWTTPWDSFDFTGLSNEKELTKLLDSCALRMTKEEVLPDLPSRRFKVVELDLPVPQQEKKLDVNEILLAPDRVPFEALSDIRKMNAERKIPLAVKYINDLLESTSKVVVFAHHKFVVDELMEKLKVHNPVKITGATSTSGSVRQDIVKQFQQDPKTRVFIGNIDAAGYGITLTAASDVVFVEASWTPKDLMQCVDRCHRIGQLNAVIGHVLTIHQSIDAQVLHSVLRKLDISNTVIKETKMSKKIDNPFQIILDKLDELDAKIEALSGSAVKQVEEVKEAIEEVKEEIEVHEVAEEVKMPKASLDDVREAFANLLAKRESAFAKELLAKYEAKKVSDIDPGSFGNVVADAKAKLGE